MCTQATSNDTIYGEHFKINNFLQLLTTINRICKYLQPLMCIPEKCHAFA